MTDQPTEQPTTGTPTDTTSTSTPVTPDPSSTPTSTSPDPAATSPATDPSSTSSTPVAGDTSSSSTSTSSTSTAPAGPAVGDLVSYTYTDGNGWEHPRRGIVTELFEDVEVDAQGNEQTGQFARVCELPDGYVRRLDELTQL